LTTRLRDGDREQGRRNSAALRPQDPDLTASQVVRAMLSPVHFLDRLADGLETAGLPP